MPLDLPTPYSLKHSSIFSRTVARTRVLLVGCFVFVAVLPSLVTSAKILAVDDFEATGSGPAELTVDVGFRGHCRLGAWFPLFVIAGDDLGATHYEIDSIDGDGYPVTLQGDVINSGNGRYECCMQSGRGYGERLVRLFDSGGTVVGQAVFTLNQSGQAATIHPSTRRLTVVLSASETIADQLSGARNANGDSDLPAVVTLDDAQQLPASWLAWQTVETLVISGADLDLLQSLSAAQWDAIATWNRHGGRVVVSVGVNAEALLGESGVLKDMCPGTFVDLSQIASSSRIEFFCAADEQLIARGDEPIRIARVEEVQGRVLLEQDSQPLIISQAREFGELTFVAFALDSERLVQWTGCRPLVQRIVEPAKDQNRTPKRKRGTQGSSVTHAGYTDLAGQLRVPLDQFSSVRFVSFTLVAVLIGAYILCIGPGDYFLLRKLIGKMEFTWITFPLVSLLFCGIALGVSRFARPTTPQLNQLEIVDVDQVSGNVRGNVWTHFYSPVGGKCSIDLPSKNQLNVSLKHQVVGWQGLPGDGLGGMQTSAGTALLSQRYQQTLKLKSGGSGLQVRVVDQPLRVASSRSLFSQWWGESPFQVNSRLRYSRRTKRLEGTFTNPLGLPLKNCRLQFENWIYLLPRSLEAGETVDVVSEMTERTARAVLNRRSKESEESNKGSSLPWDPNSTSINRIAEMLMFHQLAGGSQYTGLTHGYQPFIDLSDHLNLSRAILVGNLDAPVTELQLGGTGAAADAYDTTTTVLRVVFPVETR